MNAHQIFFNWFPLKFVTEFKIELYANFPHHIQYSKASSQTKGNSFGKTIKIDVVRSADVAQIQPIKLYANKLMQYRFMQFSSSFFFV